MLLPTVVLFRHRHVHLWNTATRAVIDGPFLASNNFGALKVIRPESAEKL